MAYAPIAHIIPEYDRNLYKNWWLKAYEEGTVTPLDMATDVTGGTTAAKFELDTQGFPITAGDARLIPFINGDYDLWLFPTAAEADADDTSNAIQFADNLNADPLNITNNFTFTGTIQSGYVVADKAEAVALSLTSANAGRKVFVTSADGGPFTIRYNSTPGTYTDNGGTYTGTEFIPSGGDGTIGFKRDYAGTIYTVWFGDDAAAADNSTAFNLALVAGAGGEVRFGLGTFIAEGVAVESNTTFGGLGFGSILKHKASSSVSLITSKTPATTVSVILNNFAIDGNAANQSSAVDGINLDATAMASGTLVRHQVSNLYISNTKGDGLVHPFPGRDSAYSDIVIYDCDGYGFKVNGSDSQFVNVNIGQSGEAGLYINGGAANVFTNMKSWFSGRITAANGNGFHQVNGNGNTYVNCESQENQAHGWLIDGDSAAVRGLMMSSCVANSDNTSAGAYNGFQFLNVQEGNMQISIYDTLTGAPSDGVGIGDGTTGCQISVQAHDEASFSIDGTASDIDNNYIILNNRDGQVNVASFAASFTYSSLQARTQQITLTGNITINATPKVYSGFKQRFTFIQDGTGGWSPTFNAQYITNFTMDTTLDTYTTIDFESNGTNWIQTAFNTGMA